MNTCLLSGSRQRDRPRVCPIGVGEYAVMMQVNLSVALMAVIVLFIDRVCGLGRPELIRTGALLAGRPPGMCDAIDAAQRASQDLQSALLSNTVHLTHTDGGIDA